MPYRIGEILELPLTMTQDYSLFQILGDYSIELWKKECSQILGRNGLISFIVHPDYLVEQRAQKVYVDLLQVFVGRPSGTQNVGGAPARCELLVEKPQPDETGARRRSMAH